MNRDTFCALPFTEIFLYPNGDIKPCCSGALPLGNLNNNNIEDILQSDIAKDVRQHILDGKWHPLCEQCKRQEKQGVRSERQSTYTNAIRNLELTNSTFKLERIDLRWSNTCNLSCVYCYEGFSSKWASIKGIAFNDVKKTGENSLFNLIKENTETINIVMLLGGEPLLQKQNSTLIDLLPKVGFYCLTNLSVPMRTNPIAQKLITRTANSSFGVSIETVRDKFEYVRRNSSWDLLVDNVKYFKEIQQPLEAHSLYSIYSFFNLIEFYDFITENNFKNVFWNLLESAGQNEKATVFRLPKRLKDIAIKEIDECEKKYKNAPGIETLQIYRNNLINTFDDLECTSKHHLDEITSLELLQPYHKTFKDIWPSLYNGLIKC